MGPESQLAILLELVENIGIEVRQVSTTVFTGDSPGGIVRLRGKDILFVNPQASVHDRVKAVAEALASRNEIHEIFLPPAIRSLLEKDKNSW